MVVVGVGWVMDGFSWVELEELYLRARGHDSVAWVDLEAEITRRLLKWLQSRIHVQLPTWELEDISHSAFEETTLRFAAIPTLANAWRFTCKCAFSLTLRRLRKSQSLPILSGLDRVLEEVADPDPLSFIRQTDFCDELEACVRALSKADAQLVFAIVEVFLSGPFHLAALAEKVRMSASHLKRRLACLSERCHRRLSS